MIKCFVYVKVLTRSYLLQLTKQTFNIWSKQVFISA